MHNIEYDTPNMQAPVQEDAEDMHLLEEAKMRSKEYSVRIEQLQRQLERTERMRRAANAAIEELQGTPEKAMPATTERTF